MTTSARDIIQDAVEKIGIYAPGETMTDADASRGLSVLNDMLDQWSNESLACFALSTQSAALQVGVSAYTIGSGGTFNMTRPLRLIEGPGAGYVLDAQGNSYPLAIVPEDEWNLIPNRGSTTTSNIPNTLFYDPQFPLGIMNFWPYPNAGGYTAYWTSYLQLAQLAALATAVTLPPGYKDALQKNLAVELWGYFKEGMPDQFRVKQAMDSKGVVKRTNIRTMHAVYDPELVSRATGTYNIYTDSPGTRSAS